MMSNVYQQWFDSLRGSPDSYANGELPGGPLVSLTADSLLAVNLGPVREKLRTRVAADHPGLSGGEVDRLVSDIMEAELARIGTRQCVFSNERLMVFVDLLDGLPHLSFRGRDREVISDRDLMHRLGRHFAGQPNWVVTHLYPSRARVVDTANQYHLFLIGMDQDPEEWTGGVLDELSAQPIRRLAVTEGADSLPVWCQAVGPPERQMVLLRADAAMTWRRVQAVKDFVLGPQVDAIDVLTRVTAVPGGGVLLVADGMAEQIGFRAGWITELDHEGNGAEPVGARQAALARIDVEDVGAWRG